MQFDFTGGYALQPIDAGRLFVRKLPGDQAAFLGVIDVPAILPTEHLFVARVNSRLWLDTNNPVALKDRCDWNPELSETDVSGLLTDIKFRSSVLPDAVEMGLRASEMNHDNPSRRWAIAFGAIKDIRGWPQSMQTDGLFELDKDGPKLVSREPFAGSALGSLLREAVWGEGGKFGLRHSLDPVHFPAFIKTNRELNMRQDKLFAKFSEAMNDYPEMPLVYTRAEHDAREALTKNVLRALMAGEFLASEGCAKSASSNTAPGVIH